MRRWIFALLLVASAAGRQAWASSGEDRVTFGSDVTVAEGETAGDIVCAFCSVHVHGQVNGDIAVLFGRVAVDEGQKISGDVATLGADLNLGEGAAVDGDVAIAAGQANLAPGAVIHGDRMVLSGHGWLLVPLAPLLILAGLIWLIVWIVRRNRYRSLAYPTGRRF